MQIINKKLAELIQPEKNIRIHSETQLKEYEKSIKMFGQLRPIVIDENNKILAGNGLYETLVRMGHNEAQCYQYSNLTENQKKKLMIADNKIFTLGIDNMDTLNQFLEDLQGDLEIPGFDEELLKQMVADADEITEMISEYGSLDAEEIQSVRERADRVEQREQKSEDVAPIQKVLSNDKAVDGGQVDYNTHNMEPLLQSVPAIENDKYIICPECGCKVWL